MPAWSGPAKPHARTASPWLRLARGGLVFRGGRRSCSVGAVTLSGHEGVWFSEDAAGRGTLSGRRGNSSPRRGQGVTGRGDRGTTGVGEMPHPWMLVVSPL